MKNEKAVAAERQEELARWERRCRKIQQGLRIAMMVMVLFTGVMTMAFAADPLAPIQQLSTFIGSAIKAIGMIILLFGVVQVGLSVKSHDATQRSQGFLTFLGGVIIAFPMTHRQNKRGRGQEPFPQGKEVTL